MGNNIIPIQPHNLFVTQEERETYIEQTLREKAELTVDSRIHGNLRVGAIFECYIFLVIEHIIKTLSLQDKLKISHNPFTYRRYFSRRGKGLDLMLYQKITRRWDDTWKPLIAIECKSWKTRWLSPTQLKTHVISRFSGIVNTTKLLIAEGIRYANRTKHLLQLHQITHIPIKQMYSNIVNTLTNMSKNIHIHKHKYVNNLIPPHAEHNHVSFNDKIIGSDNYERENISCGIF